VDHDHLELTVKINDPKMYTKPWVAVDRYVSSCREQFRCQRDDLFAVRICELTS